MRRALLWLDKGLYRTISAVVITLLLGMVFLSFTQVVLRNVAATGFPWADVVLRHLVLAVGMFGAVLAARQGRQISIDLLSRIAGKRITMLLSWIGGLFTIVISLLMARAAWVFVAAERSFGSELFSGLPAWYFQVVIPLGFGLLALQSALNLLLGRGLTEALAVEVGGRDQTPQIASGEESGGRNAGEER